MNLCEEKPDNSEQVLVSQCHFQGQENVGEGKEQLKWGESKGHKNLEEKKEGAAQEISLKTTKWLNQTLELLA